MLRLAFSLVIIGALGVGSYFAWDWAQTQMRESARRDHALAMTEIPAGMHDQGMALIERQVAEKIRPGPNGYWMATTIFGYETTMVRPNQRVIRCRRGDVLVEFGADTRVNIFLRPDGPHHDWPVHEAFFRSPAGEVLTEEMCKHTVVVLDRLVDG
jgi:hypothetical protein